MKRDRRFEYQYTGFIFYLVSRFNPGNSTRSGFTLPEVLTVLIMIGILLAIAVPNWFALRAALDLNAGQDQVWQAMRLAQTQAKYSHSSWRANFRRSGSSVEWTAAPVTDNPAASSWQSLNPAIQIDTTETTLRQSDGIFWVEFNHQGNVMPPFGRLTLQIRGGGKARRCVVVSTLLGALRKASNNAVLSGGRSCY
jgi:prepilin-type N-terminal cleavage/methylation domain-containing protein